jgi:hypothetical protein
MIASSPPKLSTEEPHGKLGDVPIDLGDDRDQKHCGKEVQNILVQSPIGRREKPSISTGVREGTWST